MKAKRLHGKRWCWCSRFSFQRAIFQQADTQLMRRLGRKQVNKGFYEVKTVRHAGRLIYRFVNGKQLRSIAARNRGGLFGIKLQRLCLLFVFTVDNRFLRWSKNQLHRFFLVDRKKLCSRFDALLVFLTVERKKFLLRRRRSSTTRRYHQQYGKRWVHNMFYVSILHGSYNANTVPTPHMN